MPKLSEVSVSAARVDPGYADARLSLRTQLEFLDVAAKEGLETAVKNYGEILTAGEAQALRALSRDELVALRAITEKIATVRRPGGVISADDWTCVNVVC